MTPRQEKHLKTGKIEIPIILVRTMVTKEEFKQIPYYHRFALE